MYHISIGLIEWYKGVQSNCSENSAQKEKKKIDRKKKKRKKKQQLTRNYQKSLCKKMEEANKSKFNQLMPW